MKGMVLWAALALAGAAQAAANPHAGLLRIDLSRPGASEGGEWRFTRELRKQPNGRKLAAGRLSWKGPAWSSLPVLRADAVFVPRGGDPKNYRLGAELGAETALSRAFSARVGWSEEHDSSFKPAPRQSETRWAGAVSLRF